MEEKMEQYKRGIDEINNSAYVYNKTDRLEQYNRYLREIEDFLREENMEMKNLRTL